MAEAVAGVGGKGGSALLERPWARSLGLQRGSGAQGAGAGGGGVKSGLSGRKCAGAEVRPGSGPEGSWSCLAPSSLARSLPPGRWGARTLGHRTTRFPNVRLLTCPILGRSHPTSCCCPTSYPAWSGSREVCLLCPDLGLLPPLPATFSLMAVFCSLGEGG